MTKMLALVAVLTAASPAMAEPPAHTDAGLLCELTFREGSARLPDAAGSQLQQVAAWAAKNWDAVIVIDGHADARGQERGNLRLSMRRARLVERQLIALGVNPSQIFVAAFGPEDKKAPRVAIWGTTDSVDSITAARERAKPAPSKAARPSPARRR